MKRFEDVIEFHGHSCPGLALGYRVSQRALKELKNRSDDEEIVAIVENNSCAVDAVQAMTGCTFGKGNLIFRDYGKQVYTFLRRPSGKGIRLSMTWEKPAETEEEKSYWHRYAKGDRTKKVLEFVHSRKAAKTRQILDAEEDQLFIVTKVKDTLPPEAEIYESVACAVCNEKIAVPKAIDQNGLMLCVPCSEKRGKKR